MIKYLIVFLFFPVHANAQDAWHVPAAPYRYRSSPANAETAKAPASTATLHPTGRDPLSLTPKVFTPEGTEVPSRVLWANPGEPLEVAFETSSGAESYFIYLTDSPSPSPYTPKAGLLLESKNLPTATSPTDVKAFVDLWNRPDTRPAGRSFRPSIFQGFPPHRPSDVFPARYTPSGAPTALHRYVGYFPVPKISDDQRSNIAKTITDWQEKLKAGQEEERTWSKQRADAEPGLQSAQAELTRAQEAKKDEATINKLSRARDLAQKRFDEANQRFEIATKQTIPTANHEIAIARQAQAELKDAVYTFHLGSVAGSWLLIDERQLAQWPADKAPEQENGKYKDLASGQISLSPGVHKLEFFHYANAADHLAILAWRPPGSRQAALMSASAFVPTGRQNVTATEFKPGTVNFPLHFRWNILRDYRVEGADDIVELEFAVTNPQSNHAYLWTLGDGDSISGQNQIRHAYFRTGTYKVTLEELDADGKPVRSISQDIEAHVLFESREIPDLAPLQEAVLAQNLAALPFAQLTNAYRFARLGSPEYQQAGQWREKARAALTAQPENLPKLDPETLTWLAADSSSFRAKAYDAALATYTALLPKLTAANSPVRLAHVELLLHAFGKTEEAEKALSAFGDPTDEDRPRWNLLQADLLLAKNLPQQAAEFLDSVAPQMDPAAETRFQVTNRSILRHARLLSEKEDLDQIAHAIDMLDSVSRADPPMHLSPELNLIKLELYLARRDFVLAYHLSDRLLHLDFSELVRPKILGAQVRALHGIGATDEAKKLFADLKSEYPYSPAVGTAEKALQ